MAFLRYAKARIAKTSLHPDDWNTIRRASQKSGVKISADNQIKDYTPDKYLLTHCTIIASVDVEPEPKNKKGWSYVITPETEQYVNNNEDSWERDLLLATYRTFIGGENYVEHIQIPELSKGKIVDAVARDIGESIYIDILVATDLKHDDLIQDIKERRVSTLSMGCFLPGTQVTLSDGRRISIEEIQKGDMVLTHKGRVREVMNRQDNLGQWKIRTIDAVGLPTPIRATTIHPFFVYRAPTLCACGCGEPLPNYKTAKKQTQRAMGRRFKRGHDKRIFNPKKVYSLDEARARRDRLAQTFTMGLEEVRAADLKVGDFICFPKPSFEQTCEVTIGKARLLGYFLAEGSYLKSVGKRVGVEFNLSLSEMDTYVAEIVHLLKQEFAGCCDPQVYPREDRHTVSIHISGRDIAEWFYKHGGEYSHAKRISEEAMSWPVAAHKALLGSWINGDGTLHSHGSTSGTTTSYDLICQAHMLAVRCGMWARIECQIGSRSVDLLEIVNGGFVRDEVTGILPSYTLVIGQTSSTILDDFTDKRRPSNWTSQTSRVLDDMVIFPITSIQDATFNGTVHDLQIVEDHSYIADGVAVHNCSVEYTICTQCGNVAEDDTKLCTHIKYQKGNHYIDKRGKTRKIAELCGHKSDPKSVKFIEASWVANPAFKGAVLRNVIEPEEVKEATIRAAFNMVRDVDPDAMRKAASAAHAMKTVNAFMRFGDEGFNFTPDDAGGGDAGGGDAGGGDAGGDKEKDPIKDLTDELKTYIRNKVRNELQDEISDKGNQPSDTGSENKNENLVRSTYAFEVFKKRYAGYGSDLHLYRLYEGLISIKTAGWKSLQNKGFTGRDILALSYFVDQQSSVKDVLDQKAYKAIARAGGTSRYASEMDYLTACARVMGVKKITVSMAKALIYKGHLYSYGTKK